MANPLVSMGGAPAVQAPLRNMPDMGAIKEAMQSAKRMMGMLQVAKDPMSVIRQVPALNAAYQMCNGRSFQDVCIEEYKKYGIDPNPIIEQLRG